jgi:gamma-glutamyltranspeptidase / glutathione hydrolase
MTDRWINYVLSVVVVAGLIGVAFYNQPRDRQERAEFLDQDLTEVDDDPDGPAEDRDPIELRRRDAGTDAAEAPDEETEDPLTEHAVSASRPEAVQVGIAVLDAGGNAVDAAVAVAYTLGVVEPFGSGIGGGGAMLVRPHDEEAHYYDYREVATRDGEVPASDTGVPGFVAGMAHVHERHGSVDVAELIEYAARYAEDGVQVDDYLNERLRGAAHRLPIHLLPRFFPDGAAITAGETLRQPEYAEALRLIQERGPEVMYEGELAEMVAEAVSGLSVEDLRGYEVLETEPAVGEFAGYQVVSGGAPVAGPALVQVLQVAERLGIADLDLGEADGVHALAQSWRVADAQRVEAVGDPSQETVDLDQLLSPDTSEAFAGAIPTDGFVDVDVAESVASTETDTTHVVVVDRAGTMVSMTNTLSNFFGSGLPVSGFFLNDQLKNFSPDPDSVNHPAGDKRPRSFITPTIVLDAEGRSVLGLGSPGGRRIPNILAQVLVRWAAHELPLEDAVLAPRFHLEGRTLEVEEGLGGGTAQDLLARGYDEVTTFVPTTEYYGGVQALTVDWEAGTIDGVRDDRRVGTWERADGG